MTEHFGRPRFPHSAGILSKDVPVSLGGRARIGVPKQVGDQPNVADLAQRVGRAHMPEIVNPHVRRDLLDVLAHGALRRPR